MNRYYYDLHIHSCLSPCADNDMTPANIAGMATIAGIQIMALTDHNTVKNCPAFFKAAKRQGIIPIAGMELTTSEDIHVVCLFERLEEALRFGEEIEKHRMLIKNRTDIFGEQLIMDDEDNVIGTDEFLLSNATNISYDDVPEIVSQFNGICYPAHIDRQTNGVIYTLGTLPQKPDFCCVEFHDKEKIEEIVKKHPTVDGKLPIISSDAHFLWDIRDADAYFELDDEPYSSELVRRRLFEKLRCEF